MSASAMLFAVEALFIRWMTERGIPTAVQVLFRAAGQLVWMAPLVAATGLAVFRTQRAPLHLLRGLSSVSTWGLYYLSFAFLDLATATVLSFTNVMFTTILARPLLGERVDAARWAGTIAGLVGVAIMLRPGSDISWVGALIALAAALTWCGITLTSRMLTRTERTETVVAWVGLVTTAAAFPFAVATWQPLGAADLAILVGFALFTPGIIWLLTEALRAGEASAVAPFQYLRLVVIAAFGWVLWGEVPDGWTWLGAVVILGGAVVITVAETRRPRVTP
ncbi:MAG: DMT family transporter [Acetobacteraceae bacterium]|nr:DMT family transporter [Acetobacteraceae bacterium]